MKGMLLPSEVRRARLSFTHLLHGGPIAHKSAFVQERVLFGFSLSGAELGFSSPTKHTDFGPFPLLCLNCPHREDSKGALWGIRGGGISVLKNLFSQEQVG